MRRKNSFTICVSEVCLEYNSNIWTTSTYLQVSGENEIVSLSTLAAVKPTKYCPRGTSGKTVPMKVDRKDEQTIFCVEGGGVGADSIPRDVTCRNVDRD
ncbi:hypothetical protein AVEN_262162-1 [Araneus ventricosus]|uniref:Uncharacterized protein n=1 Tax=Araneus ventricosus TaxID=182803 RepID=A0A4Y2EGX3_ARAVE|nr:hypothetical protein AVEN_262162-1 [Araneus ventricosus]